MKFNKMASGTLLCWIAWWAIQVSSLWLPFIGKYTYYLSELISMHTCLVYGSPVDTNLVMYILVHGSCRQTCDYCECLLCNTCYACYTCFFIFNGRSSVCLAVKIAVSNGHALQTDLFIFLSDFTQLEINKVHPC